jgi:hypothetical protein
MTLISILILQGCDAARQDSAPMSQTDDSKTMSIKQNLVKSGALMPEDQEKTDAAQAHRDEQAARQKTGDRGLFTEMHQEQGITLNPRSNNTLNLETQVDIIPETKTSTPLPGEPNPSGPCQERQAICVQACATAHAQAAAFAFAHASATACAWAEAWACVFTVQPFTRVCSWARSQACSTAFAAAFGAGYATDTKTVCAQQCSN